MHDYALWGTVPSEPSDYPRGRPESAGIPPSIGEEVLVAPFNDAQRAVELIDRHADELAAVIVEPLQRVLVPRPGFLPAVREATRRHGIVLIFDEIVTGFRMALGGAQEWSGVTPDLCTLAKAVANGMPLSVVAGRADLMEQLAPTGPVAHSGTYSGHLLSVLAALATLDELRRPGVYDRIAAESEAFYRDLQAVFDRRGVTARVQGLGTRFGLYFGRREPVTTLADAATNDHELSRRFVLGCLERGVYFHAYARAGAPGHAGYSLAHTPADFAETLDVADSVAADLARG
jgi:glutamate-1-semialdehyde 2,1-aminomutase